MKSADRFFERRGENAWLTVKARKSGTFRLEYGFSLIAENILADPGYNLGSDLILV